MWRQGPERLRPRHGEGPTSGTAPAAAPPPLTRQPIPPHRLPAQWRRQSNLARAHARAHVQRLAACNDERVAGRKGMQACAHGSPTRLRAPAARRGLNAQQPLAAPVQGWRRRRLPLPCATSASPLPCPPSALRPRAHPPHPPPHPALAAWKSRARKSAREGSRPGCGRGLRRTLEACPATHRHANR